MRTITTAIAMAIIASLFTVTAAVAWHVDTECELLVYDGWEYKVYQNDQVVADWTKSDTVVPAGTYVVKFRNGEKRKYVIEPCPTRELDVVVRGMLCGDPRASWKLVNKGDIPATFRWSWTPGNKAVPYERKHQVVTVAPGTSRKILHRWVRGWVPMRVFDPGLDRYVPLSDASYRVGKTLETSRWGTNGCPSGLLAGSPDFRKAHVIDRYSRVLTVR